MSLQEKEIGRLKGVIEGLPLGIVVFDSSGSVVFVNEGFKRITGYSDNFCGLDFKTVEEKNTPPTGAEKPGDKKSAGDRTGVRRIRMLINQQGRPAGILPGQPGTLEG